MFQPQLDSVAKAARAHARLGPSDAERWMTCAGSIMLTEHIVRPPSVYSAEGTAAHTVRDTCLSIGLDVQDFVGTKLKADGFEFEVTVDWVGWLQPGIDRLRELDEEHHYEHRVLLDEWLPGQFGTLDYGAYSADYIRINDLKFGAGEPVSAKRNKQLMLYALGFWWNVARHHTKATRFILEIDQPRAIGRADAVWETTLDELLAFGEEARIAGELTYIPDAPLKASEKGCRWCPIKDRCDERTRFALELLTLSYDELDAEGPVVLPKFVTAERRSKIVLHGAFLRSWIKDLETATLRDALSGSPTPGIKPVDGKSPAREWVDETKAEILLKSSLKNPEQMYTKKLISPTQAEKLLGTQAWKEAKKLISAGEKSPTLVPDDDPRERIKLAVDMFAEVGGEDESPNFDDLI